MILTRLDTEDKSTQTEPVVVNNSWQPVDQSSDSQPELQGYEISKIISDAIDKLPPGSLQPLEESIFAPGSKRNLEYQATLKTKVASPRMPSDGKAKVSDSNDPHCSKGASKSDPNGLTFSNRFSSLAGRKGLEKVPQVPQVATKSLIGPGLYARSVRPIPKEIDSEDVKGQIHTYSPGPGMVLKYESIEKPSQSRNGAHVAEKPRASSSNYPSTLYDSVGTKNSRQDTQLPPHLRVESNSDPVKSENASIVQPIQVGSSKASHLDSPTIGEITFHSASAVKSTDVEEEGSSASQSPTTSAIKSAEVEEEGSSSSQSPTTSALTLVAFEGQGPSSSSLINENQPYKSSPAAEKLPPHLRNTEHQMPQRDLYNPIIKSNESTLSPFSNTDAVAPHRKSTSSTLQQVLSTRYTDTKPKVTTLSSFSSTDKLTPEEKSEAIVARHAIPVTDGDNVKLNEPTSSSFSSTDKMSSYKKGEIPFSEQFLSTSDASTQLKESTLLPFSGKEKLATKVKIEAPAVQQNFSLIDPNIKPNHSNPWLSSDTPQAVPSHDKALGASSGEDVGPDLKDALYFKAWPKSEPRDTPGSFFYLI